MPTLSAWAKSSTNMIGLGKAVLAILPTLQVSKTSSRRRAALHRVRLPALEHGLLQNRRIDASARPVTPRNQRNLLADAAAPCRVKPRGCRRHVCGEDDVVHFE